MDKVKERKHFPQKHVSREEAAVYVKKLSYLSKIKRFYNKHEGKDIT